MSPILTWFYSAMAQQKHPAIITRAHLGYHDRAESISTDVKGNVFVSMYQIGVLHLRPGSAPAWVDVGEVNHASYCF